MSDPTFILDVETNPVVGIVRLCLTDEEGLQLGANQVCLAEHSPALWQGLFDTRAYVQTYAGGMRFTDRPATAEDLLEQIGVFLGTTVLGPVITKALTAGIHHRTLVVRQPQAPSDRLAAAFARVPWEIARSVTGADALFKKNLVVRMETPGAEPAYGLSRPVPAGPLRVLLVFAEAGSSPPLAMRLEREQLLGLFYDEVMPRRQVEVDVLCHGVTRRILREKIRNASGYYVVHWSGHGDHNLLELMSEDGKPDHLTGADLVGLFAESGGFIPQLVFLSACLSGTLVRDRAALKAALRGEVRPSRAELESPEDTERLIAEQPGYTGTAMALLGAGVPQVVAMRYEVGDAYARDLAGLFYKRLLADDNLKAAASALSIARSELLNQDAPEHNPVDHATPLLLGRDIGPLQAPSGRSAALRLRRPQPQPLLTDNHDLDRPAELVGRGEPLFQLRGCLEGGRPAVALVQGLAGLGKTALVAEAVHLWHRQFDGVFAFQAKPLKLGLDDFLRRLDERLTLYSEAYRVLCKERPNAAVYLLPSEPLSGDKRWRQMRENLLETLRSERLLLVIDNFETNLESVSGPDGYACTDPEWDRLLQYLAAELSGSGSRLLLTSRHRLAVLASPEMALWLRLGPLPMPEAVLFVQGSEALRRLAYSDEEGYQLVIRLLEVSRGHPLILARLGTLADNRKELTRALDVLAIRGLNHLADVFTQHSSAERRRELAYLEEAVVGAVDLLIRRASRKARWLLWLVTLASDPVTERMIQGVCSGKSLEEEFREGVDLPSVRPLLLDLRAAGLLTVNEGGDGTYELYSFHEVIREGVTAWMTIHPEEKEGWTDEEVWVAYGERYAMPAEFVFQKGVEGGWAHAMEASRRGLAYFARARAFDRLSPIASRIVTSTQDLRILREVIGVLEEVSGEVPAGKARWNLKTNLADAWRQAGHSDIALPFYKQAMEEAEAADHWPDVQWIGQNWALALSKVDRLSEAKSIYLQIADAGSKGGSPRADILASEFEALRIDTSVRLIWW